MNRVFLIIRVGLVTTLLSVLTLAQSEQLLAEAAGLRATGRIDAFQTAVQKYETALTLLRAGDDSRSVPRVLILLAECHFRLSAYQKVKELGNEALQLSRAAQLPEEEINALNLLAKVSSWTDEADFAKSRLAEALRLSQERNYLYGQATALNISGESNIRRSDYDTALRNYQQALPLWQSLSDARGEAQALTGIGGVYDAIGEYTLGYTFIHDQALPKWRQTTDKQGYLLALANLAICYKGLGDLQKALDTYKATIEGYRELGDQLGEDRTLSGPAHIYLDLGQYEVALGYFTRLLDLNRRLGSRYLEKFMLLKCGQARLGLSEQTQNSTERQRAIAELEESRAAFTNIDPSIEAYALKILGDAYRRTDAPKALGYYEKALEISRQVRYWQLEGAILNSLGLLLANLNQPAKAAEEYQLALELGRRIEDHSLQALSLFNLARLQSTAGHLLESHDSVKQAIKSSETFRGQVANPSLRTSYFATVREYYELYVDVLMRLNRPAEALQVSERSRSRSLLESLGENRTQLRQGADAALLRREKEVQQKLNAAAARHTDLLSKKDPPAAEVEESARKVRALEAEADQIRGELRRNSPRYAALTQTLEVKIERIQELLGPDTTLLEYSLGEERSYLWAVNQKGVTSYVLPPRKEIEALAWRVQQEARKPPLSNEPKQQQAALERFNVAAAPLSQMLLGPVVAQIQGQRLAVVAEGALQLVPFAALPEPAGSSRQEQSADSRSSQQKQSAGAGGRSRQQAAGGAGGTPHSALRIPHLLEAHEIVYLPSAAVLEALARETQGRTPAPKTVAILADPVFDTGDKRYLQAQNPAPAKPPTVLPKPDAKRGEGFGRLVSSGWEAASIQQMAGPGESLVATDFAATRELALSPALREYRSILFATHAVVDAEQPGLSRIVFSLVDKKGQPQDGYLRLHDIYNLDLPADLVVLSACQTGIGKEVKGEGLSSLARGFMYAGTPRVVASLWSVDDASTQQLITKFYAALLQEKKPPAAALRAAQLAVRAKYPAPYHWAAFGLQGQWQ